jgi:hypothetical protein
LDRHHAWSSILSTASAIVRRRRVPGWWQATIATSYASTTSKGASDATTSSSLSTNASTTTAATATTPTTIYRIQIGGAGNPAPEAQTRSVAAPGRKRWTVAQLRASDAIIPLQSGTNQFASQAGMTGFGRPRNNTTPVFGNILDTINPDPNAVPDTVIPLQYGTNQYASQRGMTGFGQPRDVTGKHLHRLHEDDPDFVPDPSQGQW